MIKGKSDIFICLGRLLFHWFKVNLNLSKMKKKRSSEKFAKENLKNIL